MDKKALAEQRRGLEDWMDWKRDRAVELERIAYPEARG